MGATLRNHSLLIIIMGATFTIAPLSCLGAMGATIRINKGAADVLPVFVP